MEGRVAGLYLNRVKGQAPEPVQVLNMEVGEGISGDRHRGKGRRQVSITSKEVKKWMDDEEEKGFCFTKFKENMTLEGIPLENLKVGDILEMGGAQVQLTECNKDCHAELCSLPPEKMPCKLVYNEVFAKVISSGEVSIGDRVNVRKQC